MMQWLRPTALGARLIGVVLLTTMAALAVALGAMVGYDLHAYHRAWLSDVSTQAELLGHTSAPALAFDDAKSANDSLALLRLRPQVRAAAIYASDGRRFASYALSPDDARYPDRPLADGATVTQRELVVFKRVIENGELLGTVYLRADYELYDRVLNYAGIAAAVALVAMLVALALSAWLQRIVTRPILAIGRIAREVVQQRDYSRRAEKVSNDEVGSLVDSFNRMLAEIEQHSQEKEAALREIAREMGERQRAQQEVMQLNQGLEQRVQERTAQLESSNRELVQATETAEKANRAKSEFISSMSHELRTPLNAILGFGQLLAAGDASLPPPKRAEFTQHILKAGAHLLKLIDEILDLAKIESANLMLSLEPVALAEVLDECRTMVEPAATERGLRVLFPENTPLGVIADRTRLKQVLLNLLSNAIKYNREYGTVIVDCTHSTASGCVHIAVRDTGAGLRPEQVAALFQPFNRLGQEAGAVQGTGIGLVVTKRLVELMGGKITVSSTPGVGSVFSVDLKSAAATSVPTKVDSEPMPFDTADVPGEALRPLLLYVEDNPANLRLVEEIVALRGDLRQLSAPDGQWGIQLARTHLPQVILMDINLPGLTGSDALTVLRSDPATAHIPVIALSANAMPRDIARGMATGFFRYITKPVNVDQLNRAIDQALAQAREGAGTA
jgi:signal transduction histidine kinase/ActR/RegA family two-component response regulator